MMLMARLLVDRGDTSRTLFLYDTFEGMSAPTSADKTNDGRQAANLLNGSEKGTGAWGHGIWCYASIDDVRRNLQSTGYPMDKVRLIKGKVEDTIPQQLPGRLAILRLDTDWYESTKHELQHLFPLLTRNGMLILDDYGVWQGARKAVDEYFDGKPIHLHRIDECGRSLMIHD
jgi:O-methyltransferase